ncbi:hypothetical protein O3Q52_07465 [Streptomyces sp. ActVer]|nr:hypothetical protein [Streptomyces sp. ActVer]MCZ4508043.1 hypothetical protein [Streptomyces sp. ActVer]
MTRRDVHATHPVTTHREEQRLLTAVTSRGHGPGRHDAVGSSGWHREL